MNYGTSIRAAGSRVRREPRDRRAGEDRRGLCACRAEGLWGRMSTSTRCRRPARAGRRRRRRAPDRRRAAGARARVVAGRRSTSASSTCSTSTRARDSPARGAGGLGRDPGARGCTPQSCGFRDSRRAARARARGRRALGAAARGAGRVRGAERDAVPGASPTRPQLGTASGCRRSSSRARSTSGSRSSPRAGGSRRSSTRSSRPTGTRRRWSLAGRDEARDVRRRDGRPRRRRRDRRPRRADDARVVRARRRGRDRRARAARGREAAAADRPEEVLPHRRELPRARGGVEAGRLVAQDRALDRLLPERRRDRRPGRARHLPGAPDRGARLRARARRRHRQGRQVVPARGGDGLRRRLRDLQRHHRARHPAPRDAVRRLLLLQGDRHVLPARAVDRDAGRDPRSARPGDGAAGQRRGAPDLALGPDEGDDPGDPLPLLGARVLGRGRALDGDGVGRGRVLAGRGVALPQAGRRDGGRDRADRRPAQPGDLWQEAHGEPRAASACGGSRRLRASTPLLDAVGALGELAELFPDAGATGRRGASGYPELFDGVAMAAAVHVVSDPLRRPDGARRHRRRAGRALGLDAEREEGLLPALAAAGVAPEDVDVVFLTHLHVDHVGWNTDRDGRLVFPNARYVTHGTASSSRARAAARTSRGRSCASSSRRSTARPTSPRASSPSRCRGTSPATWASGSTRTASARS